MKYSPRKPVSVAVMSGTVTVYDDYSLSASPPRFLPDTKKPLPCQDECFFIIGIDKM